MTCMVVLIFILVSNLYLLGILILGSFKFKVSRYRVFGTMTASRFQSSDGFGHANSASSHLIYTNCLVFPNFEPVFYDQDRHANSDSKFRPAPVTRHFSDGFRHTISPCLHPCTSFPYTIFTNFSAFLIFKPVFAD
jgi:hypothetical protein